MDFAELRQRCQDNLVRFLEIELDVAETFSKMAGTAEECEHRSRLLGAVAEAVETVDRFKHKIGDPSVRRELDRKAAKLHKAVFGPARQALPPGNVRAS